MADVYENQLGFPTVRDDAFGFPEIFAGDYPVSSEPVVVAAGAVIPMGGIVGLITSGPRTGKVVLSVAAAADGSQVPYGVMAFGVDATDGDKAGSAHRSGQFDQDALTYGGGHSASTVKAAFADKPIFLKKCAHP